MDNFFPTDVHVRLEGDKEASFALQGAARNALFKAIMAQKAQPGLPVQIIQYLPDGGFISVMLIDEQKIVTINTVPKTVPENPEEEAVNNPRSIFLLSGIEKGASTVTVMGKDYLRSFKPTPSCAKAHNLNPAYHDNQRLATTDNQPKASMYSGAMKRVVAAVEGLGKITDASTQYLTPEPITRVVLNKYYSSSTITHGIIKTGPKNHWLIEISATRGVLAMPLPLINSTVGKVYAGKMRQIGDTGALAVCLEFGGLPSGETFPTSTALTTAIAKGKVLQLATAADLDPYYKAVTGETHTIVWSWAFPETGNEAQNVRYVYKKLPGDPLFSLMGERWGIQIVLSKHDKSAVFPKPVGTGSATLVPYESGRITLETCIRLYGSASSETCTLVLNNYISLFTANKVMTWERTKRTVDSYQGGDGFGAPLYVFYLGDKLERVNYTPLYYYSPYTTSPSAIVTTSVDLRHINNTPPDASNYYFSYDYAVIPGFCREGVLIGTTYRTHGSGSTYGVRVVAALDRIGIAEVEVVDFGGFPPSTAFPVYFGAVINPGKTVAYNITKSLDYSKPFYGLPYTSPGYFTYNLLSGSEPITLDQTTFIGGY